MLVSLRTSFPFFKSVQSVPTQIQSADCKNPKLADILVAFSFFFFKEYFLIDEKFLFMLH